MTDSRVTDLSLVLIYDKQNRNVEIFSFFSEPSLLFIYSFTERNRTYPNLLLHHSPVSTPTPAYRERIAIDTAYSQT